LALAAPAFAQTGQATVRGVVRDRSGIPQIGASVELLRENLTVVALAHTDARGAFTLDHLLPGMYTLRATEEAFLPTLREGLRLAANRPTVANLTMSTLFEAVEWLPAERRSPSEPADDWKWTLRANPDRPLLRFTDDGPVVVTAEGNSAPESAVRLQSVSGSRRFGDGGARAGLAYQHDLAQGGRLLMFGNAAAGDAGAAGVSTVLAAERPMGPRQTLRTAVTYRQMPVLAQGSQLQSLQALALRTAQTTDLSPGTVAEFGTEMEALAGAAPQTFPFASLTWRGGDDIVSVSFATSQDAQHAEQFADEDTTVPAVTERGGQLLLEHGLHGELRWIHTSASGARAMMAVYDDRIANPVLNGGGAVSYADGASGMLLSDPVAGVLRAAGPSYGGAGFLLQGDAPLTPWLGLSLAFADGPAVEMPGYLREDGVALHQILSAARGQNSPAATLAAEGRNSRTDTHWRASYRWQRADSLTAVDPFDAAVADAYLSLFLRQPIHVGKVLPGGVEALFDIRNLLAQGYRPFLTADGSTVFFAQVDRSIQGGIAFNF
jgi:hypothetical protein